MYVLSVLGISDVCCICFIWMLQKYIGGYLHILHMLQLFQRHVASICIECFRDMFHLCFFGCMLQICLSGCCICFTQTLHAYGCNGFLSVSEACFKCFNCLQTYVATVVFGCFKRRSGVASLHPSSVASSLPAPAGHPYDAAAVSFRIGGAARPSSLCCSGGAGPAWSAKQRAARASMRTSGR